MPCKTRESVWAFSTHFIEGDLGSPILVSTCNRHLAAVQRPEVNAWIHRLHWLVTVTLACLWQAHGAYVGCGYFEVGLLAGKPLNVSFTQLSSAKHL